MSTKLHALHQSCAHDVKLYTLTCTKIFGCKNNTHTVVYYKVFDPIFEISPYSHGQNAYRIEGHIATHI